MPSERRLTAGGGVGCPQGINTGKHAVSIESLCVAKGGHNVSRWGATAAAGARGACPRPPPPIARLVTTWSALVSRCESMGCVARHSVSRRALAQAPDCARHALGGHRAWGAALRARCATVGPTDRAHTSTTSTTSTTSADSTHSTDSASSAPQPMDQLVKKNAQKGLTRTPKGLLLGTSSRCVASPR